MASVLREFEHLRIHLEELKKATNSFSSKVIGKGGFGEVYEGIVSHHKGRSIVAIKRLNRELGQGDAEFWKEIMMLSRYTHKNLISLLGFCDEDGEKIIVYEHAYNGSLDHHLSSTALTWTQRLKICLDVARGLAHLHDHNGTQQRVLHRDIKSANILLDNNWNAKLSDMGLSKLGPANQRHTVLFTNAVGTPGYCDPQYTMTYALTKESDIYSLGVVLFEVLCGTLCVKCTNGQLEVLVPMWKQSYKHKKLDQIIFKGLIPTMDPTSLKTFSKIAFQCLDSSREQRPTISLIVEKLEIALKLQEGREMKQDNAVGTSQTYLNVILSKGKGLFLGKKGQQWISPSSYNNMTGGRTGLMLTGETSESRGNNDDYFQSQSVNGGEDSYEEDGPGVENFQIIGDANPGGKLLGCGFPVRGTSLCMFQWTRHLQDGSREYIEGATNPDYVVTADDVNKLIAVECIPMDDQGRQGRIVRRFANKQNKISCDSKMQQKIDGYMSARQASFSVLLLMDPSKKWEQATFILRRFDYQIRINRTQSIFIEEEYSGETVIKIPTGSTTQIVLTRPDGSSNHFAFNDVNSTRDTFVLTMRMFQSKKREERRFVVHLNGTMGFTLEDLLRGSHELMGVSTYGTYYKSTVENGNHVAVHRFKGFPTKCKTEVQIEINWLGNIRHPNLLAIRASYLDTKLKEKLLFYDYMSKGSLATLLHDSKRKQPLNCAARMQIAVGVARGLHCLHTRHGIIHGDLTSSNVFLDKNINPRISDYGLSQFITVVGYSYISAKAGVLGYQAPELSMLEKANTKTDVYSLGVIMLELLTGKSSGEMKNKDLPQWLRSIRQQEWFSEAIDIEMVRDVSLDEEGISNVLQLAMDCVSKLPHDRPDIQPVLQRLEHINAHKYFQR